MTKKKNGDGSADSENTVGYKKPPKKNQFKKGVSGNPKGRPKGSKNIFTIIEQAFDEKVTVNLDGEKPVKIDKRTLSMKQFANKAAKGDMRAIEKVLSIYKDRQDYYDDYQSLLKEELEDFCHNYAAPEMVKKIMPMILPLITELRRVSEKYDDPEIEKVLYGFYFGKDPD